MEVYQFGAASSILYDFVYDDFCSYYLEMSKVALTHQENEAATKATLYKVIKEIILLIYPYCPFIAEEMYCSLPGHKDSIMLESYPEYEADLVDKKAEKEGKLLAKMLSDVRGYKASHSLAPNAKIKLALSPKAPFPEIGEYLARFLFASEVKVSKLAPKGDSFLYGGLTLVVEQDIDPAELKVKLLAEKKALEFEVARGEKMLANPGFVAKAPKEKLDLEKSKLADNRKKLDDVLGRLQSL